MLTISKMGVWGALFTGVGLTLIISCKNKPDYDGERKQLLLLHDKVMADGGKAESNEMLFDSLLKSGLKELKLSQPALDTSAMRVQIIGLNKKLGDADEQMENWMHSYNNVFRGKSDQKTFDYYHTEKLKVAKLDSLYQSALKLSGNYLEQLHIKPIVAEGMRGKMKM